MWVLRKSSAWICSRLKTSINVHFLELTTALHVHFSSHSFAIQTIQTSFNVCLLLCNSPLFSSIHFYPFFRWKRFHLSFLADPHACYFSMMKKSIVDHTYLDHSQDVIEHYQWSNKKLFPAKLHEIVTTPEYQHIIAWKPHGRGWALVDKSLFISVVLPKHFNHSNFGSFNRSVNGWGFKVCFAHYLLCIISARPSPSLNFSVTGLIDIILHTASRKGGAWSERLLPSALSSWQAWVGKCNDSFDQPWETALQVSISMPI